MSGCKHRQLKARAFGATSAAATIACGIAATPSAFAQAAVADAAAAETLQEVVVTSTRVVRDGYEAPTPTSVIGAEEIAAKAPANLADFVNTLPSLQGSTTPRNTTASTSSGNAGINALSLRNLGPNRTLVLLDGKRVGASSVNGLVDINQFPQALVSRVDVVTGGASADWGSDAVAGVVNFILDKNFTGLKGEVQGGVTDYGDDESYKVSVAAGTGFAADRGHILISGEIAHNDGTDGIGSRDWYNGAKLFFNPNYTATNGQPRLLVRPGSGFATATPGGIITSGPLQGTHFGPGGVPLQFNYGPVVSAPYMQGGDWQYADFARTGDIDPRMSRENVFVRASFDVTERMQMFAQLVYGKADTRSDSGSEYKFASLTIRSDNAFIPDSVAARMAALGLTTITMGSLNEDLGGRIVSNQRESLRPLIGAQGNFDLLGSNWDWDAYAQRGSNASDAAANLSITANYNAAIDAVRNADGTIVCRSSLTNPTNGCVPYNVFGTGVNDQAALDYIRGTSRGHTRLEQNVFAGNLRGEPFSNWAGPISVALGVEHRREKVSGSNDPLSSLNAYFAGNYKPTFGSYKVTEGYFQTVVPLANDMPFARSLDLNLGVRATDYSTSGAVTTWKSGITYSPIDAIAIRFTRSRDIRAPNLAELFQGGQTVTTTLADPFRNNATATGIQLTRGNIDLKPERADTTGIGIVLSPRFLPGFTMSADYYNVDIQDAISTPNALQLVNQCFAGNAALCSAITRDAAGVISLVTIQPVNLAEQIARGVDLEASYRRSATLGYLDGDLTLRAMATRYLKNYLDNGVNAPTDNVGTNSRNGSAELSLPKWSFRVTAGWDQGPVSALLTARGISDGVHNTSYIECSSGCPASTADRMTIEDNHIDGALYFDAYLGYQLLNQTEVFLAVDNLANKDPEQVAYGTNVGGAPISVNPTLYDLLGRTYRLGFRLKM